MIVGLLIGARFAGLEKKYLSAILVIAIDSCHCWLNFHFVSKSFLEGFFFLSAFVFKVMARMLAEIYRKVKTDRPNGDNTILNREREPLLRDSTAISSTRTAWKAPAGFIWIEIGTSQATER